MKKKILAASLALLMILSSSVSNRVILGAKGSDLLTDGTTAVTSQIVGNSSTESLLDVKDETKVTASKQLSVNNLFTDGSFENSTTGFSSTSYNVVTETNGNSYASVSFDSFYQSFVSQKTSLQANTTYTFSADYFIPSDDPNMFACGLSTIAGHPGAGQFIIPNETAPFTISNLGTGGITQSSTTSTSLVYYGTGTRTLAADGIDRSDGGGTGGWRRFTTTFSLASAAPSVYFFFMSYEQGKKPDNTALPFVANKKISFDNVIITKQIKDGNHINNGNFENGAESFTCSGNLGVITEAGGNLYSSATFNAIYQALVSDKTSLKAGTSYTFSCDYFIPADNPNQFAFGLSTVAGHPGTGQNVIPSGKAPYTITDLATNTVIQSLATATSLIHYGSGTRTLAVDGVNRSDSGETGGWKRFSTTFTLSSDAPSIYFYYMSYEQGKVNSTTALPFVTEKKVSFDNVTIKGSYNVSVSAGVGGKANALILDPADTAGKVYDGGRVLYTAKPSYLNAFAGWVDDTNTIVSTDMKYLATPTDAIHLTATFTPYNGFKTYGAEYGISDETIDTSTNATYAASPNTSDILSLGSMHTKITAATANQIFRYNKATLEANANYTLSFYLYGTGTSSFGLYGNTASTPVVSGTNAATLNKYTVTTTGETSLGASQLPSSSYTTVTGEQTQWTHYTMNFNTGSYSGFAYFALTLPNTSTYYLLDNVSITKSSSVTVTPSAGGTVNSAQLGGTVSASTAKSFLNGTYVTLNAAPATGKGFVAWTDLNNVVVSYERSYTFCVSKPITLKPLFDTGNKVTNGDFGNGTTGWTAYGETGSNANIGVLNTEALEAETVPATPSGDSALKLSMNRTDGTSRRVQAYGVTFPTETNTTYEVSVWLYSKYSNARISLYVPTAAAPYQYDATNDFTYVGSGYNIGATQLAGKYKYFLNDVLQSQTGNYSTYTDPYRSMDSVGRKNGWTKLSLVFTTDSGANCVKNAAISLGIKSYSKDGINYTAPCAYFTDVSVKKYIPYVVENDKAAGNVTSNNKVVLSSLSGSTTFGSPITLKTDTYPGFLFGGWYKDNDSTPITLDNNTTILYTDATTLKAKYSYDPSVPNFLLGDFESVLNSDNSSTGNDGDVTGDSILDLRDVTTLSRYIAGWQNIEFVQSKLDLTGEGIIDLRDVTYLSRLIAGWNVTGSTSGNTLNVWKLLAAGDTNTTVGTPLSWGTYTVTDGSDYSIKPHGGNNMLAVCGRDNYSERQLDVVPNTDYMLSFYWNQAAGTQNALNSVAITTNNTEVKVGSQAEYGNSSLSGSFLAQNYTPTLANGTWQKYTLTFNSKSNTALKLFLNYTADSGTVADYLFLDDFSLLPFSTETNASGSATKLSVSNNLSPLNNTFTGISGTVYHCYTFMDDIYGRNYTDEMAAVEMDRLKDTGTRLVRSIFKSWFAWDDKTGTWNWESQRMKDAYQWALELQKRDINIALNASWSLPYLTTGVSNIPEVPYLYAGGDYNLACARYGEWMTEALQAFEAHGVHNITHLLLFTEPSYPTPSNLVGPEAAQWVQAANALDTAMTTAGIRRHYKLIGPDQGSTYTGEGLLNYALQNCDNVVDIYSTHCYPTSNSVHDDVFGSIATDAFTSYMTVMKRNNSVKDFWADEYLCAASDAPLGTDSAWLGTQIAVGMTSSMNAGIEGMISWQLFDQQWVDQTNTGSQFADGIHVCGTAPSLFTSAVPRSQYYALTLMSKYLGYKNGQVYPSTSPTGSGLYISCVKLENGSFTVMIANAGGTDKKIEANFGQAINQTLYRHLYDPDTIKPDARAKVIGADKVFNMVGTSIVDTIPSGGVAIYTGLGY